VAKNLRNKKLFWVPLRKVVTSKQPVPLHQNGHAARKPGNMQEKGFFRPRSGTRGKRTEKVEEDRCKGWKRILLKDIHDRPGQKTWKKIADLLGKIGEWKNPEEKGSKKKKSNERSSVERNQKILPKKKKRNKKVISEKGTCQRGAREKKKKKSHQMSGGGGVKKPL